LRSHPDPEARGGVASAPRRAQKFGPRVVEALEERALMSMGGHVHGLKHNPHTSFSINNLVSNVPGIATTTDPSLKNAWGLVASATSPWWVSDNGTGVSTVYNGNTGAKVPLTVTIPPSPHEPAGSTAAPTGIVSNSSMTAFLVSGAGTAAHFIWATEDGTIAAWNAGPTAVLKVDKNTDGAVYKGLALASIGNSNFLYATNFNSGKIDVFDSTFAAHTFSTNQFTDPKLPRGYAPFGIANLDGMLFVTYAKQNAEKHDDVAGQGHGFVDKFDTSGNLIGRVAQRGQLNSPWGLAMAPSSFGQFAGDLLVGNFGDGRINAFKPMSNGKFRSDGQLRDARNKPITIHGLWALAVGNGSNAGPLTTLFFTAGPNGEQDGLFGTLTAST
jgi:uncharacterized protein (TIGR03118 family)